MQDKHTFVFLNENGRAFLHNYDILPHLFPISTLVSKTFYDPPTNPYSVNHSGGVMFSVLNSSAVDRGLESRSDHTKGNTIYIRCFSAKHSTFRNKSNDWG